MHKTKMDMNLKCKKYEKKRLKCKLQWNLGCRNYKWLFFLDKLKQIKEKRKNKILRD